MSKINSFLDIVNDGETFVDFFLSDDLSHDGIKERSGRYDYGSGDRPYQHDPQKRELYLSVKQDSAEFGSKNGFSKETADKTARIVTVNYDIDTSSIRTGDNFSNSSERIYKNDRTATVNYDIDTSSIGSKNEYSNSSERIYKNDRTATVNHDIDTSSIGSGDKFLNSNRKMYSAGMKYYERKKYASPVFNANPSNEELTSIKNRRRLEKEVRDSFEDKSETKSSNSNQNRSTNAENGGKGNSNTPPTSNAKKDPWARTEKGGKDKPNISPAERTARDIKNTTDDLIDGASKILKSMNDNKKLKNNAEGLSNEELRERIARIRLEKEYNQLTAKDTQSGYDKTMRILNTVGTAVSVGAGVVSIVAGVKSMKAGKKYG